MICYGTNAFSYFSLGCVHVINAYSFLYQQFPCSFNSLLASVSSLLDLPFYWRKCKDVNRKVILDPIAAPLNGAKSEVVAMEQMV